VRRSCSWGAVALAVAAVIGVTTSTTPAQASSVGARVVRWLDGDTVLTTRGEVRLLGDDTPERGRCGAPLATSLARRLAPAGTQVALANPGSVRDKDRYGRLLRYVVRGTTDVGLRQIRAGAVARYDSRDGYDPHPRQGRYHRVDHRHPDYACSSAPSDLHSYDPVPGTWDCPSYAPIKGNQGSPEWIYHLPSNAYYDATNPEECFATEAAAVAAGYRPARI
jgi:hypothetical protein